MKGTKLSLLSPILFTIVMFSVACGEDMYFTKEVPGPERIVEVEKVKEVEVVRTTTITVTTTVTVEVIREVTKTPTIAHVDFEIVNELGQPADAEVRVDGDLYRRMTMTKAPGTYWVSISARAGFEPVLVGFPAQLNAGWHHTFQVMMRLEQPPTQPNNCTSFQLVSAGMHSSVTLLPGRNLDPAISFALLTGPECNGRELELRVAGMETSGAIDRLWLTRTSSGTRVGSEIVVNVAGELAAILGLEPIDGNTATIFTLGAHMAHVAQAGQYTVNLVPSNFVVVDRATGTPLTPTASMPLARSFIINRPCNGIRATRLTPPDPINWGAGRNFAEAFRVKVEGCLGEAIRVPSSAGFFTHYNAWWNSAGDPSALTYAGNSADWSFGSVNVGGGFTISGERHTATATSVIISYRASIGTQPLMSSYDMVVNQITAVDTATNLVLSTPSGFEIRQTINLVSDPCRWTRPPRVWYEVINPTAMTYTYADGTLRARMSGFTFYRCVPSATMHSGGLEYWNDAEQRQNPQVVGDITGIFYNANRDTIVSNVFAEADGRIMGVSPGLAWNSQYEDVSARAQVTAQQPVALSATGTEIWFYADIAPLPVPASAMVHDEFGLGVFWNVMAGSTRIDPELVGERRRRQLVIDRN